jgi:hypothetical protein
MRRLHRNVVFVVNSNGTDPYWLNVVALLHFDGTNGQTTTIDSSRFANTVTLSSTTLTTAQQKFGITSVEISSLTSLIISNTYCDFGSSDWTVEGQFYATTVDASRRGIVNYTDGGGAAGNIAWQISHGASEFRARVGIGGTLYTLTQASTPSTNVWHHYALVRDGSVLRLYLDGVQVASASGVSGSVSIPAIGNVALGLDRSFTYFVGYLDEFRFTRNQCRYPGGVSFAVPTAPFPNR